jgi:hypothetical protein
MKTQNFIYFKYFKYVWALIIASIYTEMLFPWISKDAITNAFTLVNGLTTSLSIIVALAVALSGLMIRELTEGSAHLKSKYFELMGIFLIPPVEAVLAYVFLASGNYDWAVKTSIAGFLTALLLAIGFYLQILSKLKQDIKNTTTEEASEDMPKVQESQNKQSLTKQII